MSESPSEKMKPLSDVVAVDKAIRCPECGGFCFFDWGLKVLHRASYGPAPRMKDFADHENIQICAKCLLPIAKVGGDYYDASEFITREDVETILARGQARDHRTPVPVMDP